MNTLAAVILFAAVAYASAGGIGLGIDGGDAARSALEGALGGQWVPDVPVAGVGAGIVAPGLAAPLLAAPGLGLGLGGLGLGGVGLGGVGLGGVGLGLAGHGSRGALEGALGGQWIPDTHGK